MWIKSALQFTILFAIVAVVLAEPPVYGAPAFSGYRSSGFGGYQGGYRSGYQSGYQSGGYGGYDDGAPQPFNFQYDVKDGQTGTDFGHHANSDGRQVQGEYQVLLPDGRRQIVKYTADDNGYNADVRYEGQSRYPQQQGGYGGYGGFASNQYPSQGHKGFGGYSY